MKDQYQYVTYHSDQGYALLIVPESTGTKRTAIEAVGKRIEAHAVKDFDKSYVRVESNGKLVDAAFGALKLLDLKLKLSESALDHIEKAMGMDTRGKSTAQIREEIVRIADELPAGHELRKVPATFPDRGQAIAAYTHVRQTIFNLTHKESVMASKKAKATEEAATNKETKAAPKKETATKKKTTAPKEKGKPKVALNGAFKLSDAAAKAKNPEGLKLHEGSSRHKLMAHIFGSKKQSHTYDELKEIVGDQASQALQVMVRLGHLVRVEK